MGFSSHIFVHCWGHMPIVVHVSDHVHLSLFPTCSFPLRTATINLCVCRITFHQGKNEVWKAIWEMPGRRYTASADAIMPMTDHFLTFIPQPARMAVCHCDSLLFVSCSLPLCDSRRTSTKMLRCSSVGKMARLFGCSFAFTLIFFFLLYMSLSRNIVSFSFSIPMSLLAPPPYPFFPPLVLIWSSFRPSPKAGPYTKQTFLFWLKPSSKGSETCVRWIVLWHNQNHENIQRHTCTHIHTGLKSILSTLQTHAEEAGVRSVQSHPLQLMSPCCCSCTCVVHLNISETLNTWCLSHLLQSLPMSLFCRTNWGCVLSVLIECIVCFC